MFFLATHYVLMILTSPNHVLHMSASTSCGGAKARQAIVQGIDNTGRQTRIQGTVYRVGLL